MLNQCTFIGRLAADPEIRATQGGDEIANFRIGVTEKWRGKDGSQNEKTEWVSVVAFGGVVKVLSQFVKKGQLVMVQGKMQTRKWQDNTGADRYSTEIVLQGFDGKLVMLGGGGGSGQDSQPSAHDRAKQDGYAPDLDDEIPFGWAIAVGVGALTAFNEFSTLIV